MYVLLALFTGGFVSVMIELSGRLQIVAGALPALVIIHLSGLATSGVYKSTALFRPRGRSPRRSRTGGNHPYSRWFALAGVLGVLVVLVSNAVFRRGGVVLVLMGTLAGQTLTAFVLEQTRWFEGRRSPEVQKIVSLALILPGAAVIGFVDRVGIGWILLSWIPGAVLMVQQMMNSRNTLRFGGRNMLLLNYVTALAALAIAVAASPSAVQRIAGTINRVPIVLLVGGGMLGVVVTALSAFLLTRAAALQITLGIYAGQIAVGIMLDAAASRAFSPVNGVGIALVVVGLLAGWIRLGRRHRARPPETP